VKVIVTVFKFFIKTLKFFFVKKSCCEYSDSCRIKDKKEEK